MFCSTKGKVRCIGSSHHLLVVVVQLRVWVCSGGSGESNRDVCLSNGGEEDVVSQRGAAVIRDGLVDYIPSVAFAFVVSDFLGDVVLKDLNQGGIVETSTGDP